MCNYKPLVMVFLFTTLGCLMMCMFSMGMWMYVGDFFPSYRYKYTWYWSIVSYLFQGILSIICSVMLYKQNPSKHVNTLCMLALVITLVNWIIHVAVSYPAMTKQEFRDYIFDYYTDENKVPVFMDYFQYKIGCCGIDDYRDYFKYFGTIIDKEKQLVTFNVPRSCCYTKIIKNPDCGNNVPFRAANEEDIKQMDLRLNSQSIGCYQKFHDIIVNQSQYQLTIFNSVFKNVPFLFIIITIIQIGIYYHYYSQTKARIRLIINRSGSISKRKPTSKLSVAREII